MHWMLQNDAEVVLQILQLQSLPFLSATWLPVSTLVLSFLYFLLTLAFVGAQRAAAFRGTTLHRWFACLYFLPSVLRCGLKPWLWVPLVWPVITVQCCSSPFSLHLHLPCCICSPLKVVTSAHSYLHCLITLESHGQSDRSTFMGLALLNCHLGSILFYFPLRWFLFDLKLLVICILKGDINKTYSPCKPKSHSLRHKLLWQCLDEWRNVLFPVPVLQLIRVN